MYVGRTPVQVNVWSRYTLVLLARTMSRVGHERKLTRRSSALNPSSTLALLLTYLHNATDHLRQQTVLSLESLLDNSQTRILFIYDIQCMKTSSSKSHKTAPFYNLAFCMKTLIVDHDEHLNYSYVISCLNVNSIKQLFINKPTILFLFTFRYS